MYYLLEYLLVKTIDISLNITMFVVGRTTSYVYRGVSRRLSDYRRPAELEGLPRQEQEAPD